MDGGCYTVITVKYTFTSEDYRFMQTHNTKKKTLYALYRFMIS